LARVPDDLFAFLAAARAASSMVELDGAFARLIQGWGFDNWTTMPIASGALAPVRPFEVVFGNPSKEWSKRYREKNYFRRDAAIRALMQSNEGIWWNAFGRNGRLAPEERRLFVEARAHGIAEGLSTPLRLANNSVWVSALTGQHSRPNWQIADAARLAAERYLLKALALRADTLPTPRKAALTDAQLGIVRLLAEGLNQKETALRLKISPRTVYNQLYLARQRLGAKTVSELVRRVTRAGLV
jgi:DNA-binding CsgD family transcriptional regulator